MRKEIEQRPVDTKVLRENFRRGLERNMNKLMSEGYVPMGGTATHMNTNTKAVLGMDTKEYTQTMVKYGNFDIWVKENDEDRAAYGYEQARQSLVSQQESVKKIISKELQTIKKLEEALEKSAGQVTPAKKSFFRNIKASISASLDNGRKERLSKTKSSLNEHKSRYTELAEQIATLDSRLDPYYKSNPHITKDILLQSR